MIDPQDLAERQELLRERLLALKRADHLFPSNLQGDKRASITVSSIALQALSDLREPEADLVYRAIVEAAKPPSDPNSPWPSQGGGPPHTISASWAVFAGVRYRLDAVHDMADAVIWLLSCQDLTDGGWPHTREGERRPFHTALALNALLAYGERLAMVPTSADLPDNTRVADAIGHGFQYLTGQGLSAASHVVWLWDQVPSGPGVCLATSSLCLHVALKAASLAKFRYLAAPACASLATLAAAVEPLGLRERTLNIADISRPVLVWPQIGENEPAYWYSYFTPLLALTFADAIRRCGSPSGCYERAIAECIRWTVYDYDADGTEYSAKGAWAIAHAILVLRRATSIVAPTLAVGSPLPRILETLGPRITSDRAEFELLCNDVDRSLLSRITSPGTPEMWWRDLVNQLATDARLLLALLAVLLERHPRSEAAIEIGRFLSGG